MAKRFTDSGKWRNEWFRTLSLEARLAWIYLCDECEPYGVFKLDYGLATFQLGFEVSANQLKEWFGSKIYFINNEKVLIIQFYEFQYGDCKDTWSAKIRAQNKLKSLGFSFKNNTLINPNLSLSDSNTTVVTQCKHNSTTSLIRDRDSISINIKDKNLKNESKSIKPEFRNPNDNASLKTELSFKAKELDEIKQALDQIFDRQIPKRNQLALSILTACDGNHEKAKDELQNIYEVPEVRGKGIDVSKRFVYAQRVIKDRFGI